MACDRSAARVVRAAAHRCPACRAQRAGARRVRDRTRRSRRPPVRLRRARSARPSRRRTARSRTRGTLPIATRAIWSLILGLLIIRRSLRFGQRFLPHRPGYSGKQRCQPGTPHPSGELTAREGWQDRHTRCNPCRSATRGNAAECPADRERFGGVPSSPVRGCRVSAKAGPGGFVIPDPGAEPPDAPRCVAGVDRAACGCGRCGRRALARGLRSGQLLLMSRLSPMWLV